MLILSPKAALCVLFVTGLTSHAQVIRYDAEKTRKRLEELRLNPIKIHTAIVGTPGTPEAKAFLDFYMSKIVPRHDHLAELGQKFYSYKLLRDSASQKSKAEFNRWTKELAKILAEWNRMTVDEQAKEEMLELARLSQGLPGELPELARKWAREAELEFVPPEFEPALNEISTLMNEYDDAVRDVPAIKKVPEFDQKTVAAYRDFKEGKITLAEGMKIVRDLHDRIGKHFTGFEAAQAKGENLNRVAVLRTQIAKAKGFSNWAEYQMEMNGQGYTPEYRGPAKQIKQMKRFLSALRSVADEYYSVRLKELGIEAYQAQLTDIDVEFLTGPGWEMLQPYFPDSEITNMWEKTLLESGFRPETLAQILVDDEFRDGKDRNNAYQANPIMPYNATSWIDAGTLSSLPMVKTKPALMDGLAYILQSYSGKGLSGLKTAFHEGGHGTERILKLKDKETDEANGYVEIPSFTSENFLRDPQILHALAVPVDGYKPSLEDVQKYVKGNTGAELHKMIRLIKRALFDLEIWSTDFTKPGAPTFLEAVQAIYDDAAKIGNVFPDYKGPVPMAYEWISTSHFTSGDVRYSGYVYAAIGTAMMTKFISDELEKESGRRNWYQQPGFAKIYAEKFVTQGWRRPIPENMEFITGRKYDYTSVVNEFREELLGCETRLAKPE